MIFDRVANGIQKHAKAIVVIWVIVLCISGFFALKSNEVMSYDMNEMASKDSESIIGMKIMEEEFPAPIVNEAIMPIIVLYYEDEEGLEEAQNLVVALNSATVKPEKITSVVAMDPVTKEDGTGILMAFVMTDGLDLFDAPAYTPTIRGFISDVMEEEGYTGEEYLTGSSAISYDMEHDALEDISKIDPFTILMILLLVGLFFRSFVSSATPPMTIGVAFIVTMALIFGIGQVMNIFFITNMMILVSMMGAGCDYCIFIIARYREELRAGLSHDDALHQAIVWAGESITISGASVIIGFGAMAVCDYSLISTMGICLALGILIALIAALTLIPAILQLIGDMVFWPTTMEAFKEGGKATKGWYAWCGRVGDRYFHKSANFSLKHAKAIVAVAILITVPSVYVMTTSEESYDMISSMLGGESGDGMKYIDEYADQGMVMPNYILVEYKDPIAIVEKNDDSSMGTLYWTDNWKEKVSPSLTGLYSVIEEDPNVAYTDGPFVWDDMMEKIAAAGITDPEEKIEFIKSNLASKSSIFFNELITSIAAMGMSPEYLFEGPGKMIDDIFAGMPESFSWNAEVAESKAKGLTGANAIVADIEIRFLAEYGEAVGQVLPAIIGMFNEQGITDDMLVYGAGPMLTQILGSDWDAAVANQVGHGVTNPDTIIANIANGISNPTQKAQFNAAIQALNEQGLSNRIIAFGFGPAIDIAITSLKVDFHWDVYVSLAMGSGLTDPDEIVEAVIDTINHQSVMLGSFVGSIVENMHASGLTNDALVYGFGSTIDYLMNVSNSIVGGPFVETGSGEATFVSVTMATKAAAMSPVSMESISNMAKEVSEYVDSNKAIVEETWNTGTAVVMYDVSEQVKKQFTFIEVLVVVLIIILLFVVMRSYLIPFRSVLTILMSITWTLAVTHLVFVNWLGGEVLWLAPILLLVICLGLGMDYDILLTTRIKENVMSLGMSNDEAIHHAITHTGSVITICGLIMGGAFGTLMISGMPMMQQFGFALCFAILVDALVVRTYIVPAVMHLLGDWNWKGPGYKKKQSQGEQ